MGFTRGDVLELLGELESEKDALLLLMEDDNASSNSKQAVNAVFDLMEELSEFKADVSRIFSTKAVALVEKVVRNAGLLPSTGAYARVSEKVESACTEFFIKLNRVSPTRIDPMDVSEARSSMDVSEARSSMDVSEARSSMDVSEARSSMDVSEARSSMDVSEPRSSMDLSPKRGS